MWGSEIRTGSLKMGAMLKYSGESPKYQCSGLRLVPKVDYGKMGQKYELMPVCSTGEEYTKERNV